MRAEFIDHRVQNSDFLVEKLPPLDLFLNQRKARAPAFKKRSDATLDVIH